MRNSGDATVMLHPLEVLSALYLALEWGIVSICQRLHIASYGLNGERRRVSPRVPIILEAPGTGAGGIPTRLAHHHHLITLLSIIISRPRPNMSLAYILLEFDCST